MELQEFQFSVIHKPGRLHNNADALSRLLAPQQNALGDCEIIIDPGDDDPVRHKNNCAITVNPTFNLKKAQQEDQIISKIVESKTNGIAKQKLAAWRHDNRLKIFWRHYDKLFVRNGLLYRH